jgi:hypothetical protein
MYTIISSRIGTPGDKFEPSDDTNIEALIEGGFIKSDKTTAKSAITNTNKAPDAPSIEE